MSTRGIYGIRKNGKDKLSYNHCDSYPDCLGSKIATFCANHLPREIGDLYDRIELISEEIEPTQAQIALLDEDGISAVSEHGYKDWYSVLRKYQGNLEALVNLKYPFMVDNRDFIKDSLFCEYGYIINLDTNKLEFWKGWQKKPQPGNRYGEEPFDPENDGRYYPCRLVKMFDLPIVESDIHIQRVVDEMNRVSKEDKIEEIEVSNELGNERSKEKLPDGLEAIIKDEGFSISYVGDGICEFGKYSSAGQDFNFAVDIGENIDEFCDNVRAVYNNFDVSYETYLWLDDTGHGTNGCPYDMKEAYEELEECEEFIWDLFGIADKYRTENYAWDDEKGVVKVGKEG